MADVAPQAVKDGVSDSAPDASQIDPAKAPADEKSAAKTTEKAVPYDRFQEVIEQKNKERELRQQYEARIRDLEARVPDASGQGKPDRIVQKLVAGGMKEDAAKLIAEAQREAAREVYAPQVEKDKNREIRSWAKELERNDPDYIKLRPELTKAFDALSEDEKQFAVSSPKGLEWFYKSVKSDVQGNDIAKARAEGVKQGYENRGLKEGMASDPKSTSGKDTPLTYESIQAGALKGLSSEDYKKRLPEINAILSGKRK